MSAGRPFVGRDQELAAIRGELDRDRPSLLVVYGRRRVGKSTLLAEALRGRDAIFYQATEVVGSMNLDLLKDEVARWRGGSDPILEGLDHWEALLTYVAEQASVHRSGDRKRVVLVLDEFPYLCDAVEGLPSIVQKVVDRASAGGLSFDLVLCGSQIAFMEQLLGERNPLRGRATLELELHPLSYREAAAFFPAWKPEDRLAAYGVFGGMPYYLQLCDPERSLRDNVLDVVLRRGAPLGSEAFNVLQAELSAPTRYATILRAVASGCTTTGDILGRTREISDGRALAPYVAKLAALRLIRITRSMDASPRARNRRYYLADPFLAFWYRFGLPSSSALAVGHAAEVYDHVVEPGFAAYMGEIFEWIGRQYVRRHAAEILPAPAREVGKIWGAGHDVDVAAILLDDTVVFGECKWWTSPVGGNVLRQLGDVAADTAWGGPGPRHLLLLGRSGFTPELLAEADASETIHLVDPGRLLEPVA